MNKEQLEALARAKACPEKHTWTRMATHFGTTWNGARNQWRRRARKLTPAPGACPICIADAGDADDDGRPAWQERGNYAEASGRVRSLDELLAIVKPDLDVWQLHDWGVKRWEVGAKIKEGHVTWADGAIVDGHLDYKGLGVEGLWSVWAKFIRKTPIPIKPVIRPVACDAHFDYPARPRLQGTRLHRGLLLPDPHFGYLRDLRTGQLTPFHDRRALDLTIQVARALRARLDAIVILGDGLDMTTFTDKYVRSPEFLFTIQPSLLELHWYLHRLREAAPDASIYYLCGNHEGRLNKILSVHLPDAYDLRPADQLALPPSLSIPRLLALHELGVEWVGDYPDGEVWLGPLRCVHGDRVSSALGGTARAVADDGDQHTAFGHIHRIERVTKRVNSRDGWRTVRTFSPGCLCHTDGRVPGSKAGANWQQGFAVVDYNASRYAARVIEIEEGECIYDGRIWRGGDYAARLQERWPDWRW